MTLHKVGDNLLAPVVQCFADAGEAEYARRVVARVLNSIKPQYVVQLHRTKQLTGIKHDQTNILYFLYLELCSQSL